MEINAAFFIWMVTSAAGLVLLTAVLFQKPPKVAPQHADAAQKGEPEAPQPAADPLHAEVKHWTAQGLHKLGYSMQEARRVAETVPAGSTLQDAIQFCLRSQGSKK